VLLFKKNPNPLPLSLFFPLKHMEISLSFSILSLWYQISNEKVYSETKERDRDRSRIRKKKLKSIMSASETIVVRSLSSMKMVNSSYQNEQNMNVKCYHNIVAVHQVCKKPPEQRKQFFWMSIVEGI